MAQKTSSPTTRRGSRVAGRAPARSAEWPRRISPESCAVPNSGIEIGVQDIHQQIGDDVHTTQAQHHCLHYRIIPVLHRLDDQQAEARPAKTVSTMIEPLSRDTNSSAAKVTMGGAAFFKACFQITWRSGVPSCGRV